MQPANFLGQPSFHQPATVLKNTKGGLWLDRLGTSITRSMICSGWFEARKAVCWLVIWLMFPYPIPTYPNMFIQVQAHSSFSVTGQENLSFSLMENFPASKEPWWTNCVADGHCGGPGVPLCFGMFLAREIL